MLYMLPTCNQCTNYEYNPEDQQRRKPFIIVYPVVNRLSFSANSSFYATRAHSILFVSRQFYQLFKNCQNPDITKILFVFPETRSIGFLFVTNFRYNELIFQIPWHFVIIGLHCKMVCALYTYVDTLLIL